MEKTNSSKTLKEFSLEKLSQRQLMSLDSCTRCGECQKWCPIYTLDNREDVTPRSKIKNLNLLIKSQTGGYLGFLKPKFTSQMMDELSKNVFECSCCNQCHFVCPIKINTVDLWENVREAMYKTRMGPNLEQKNFCETLKQFGNPYRKEQAERVNWVETGLKMGTLLKKPELIKENGASVLFFIGCTATYDEKINLVAQHAVNILQEAGVDFGILGSEENCCYGKLRRMGDTSFEELAKANIEKLNDLGIKTLVTACAGCFKTLNCDYPKIGKANFKIYHLAEYIDKLLSEGKLKLKFPVNGKITYHDPCLLGRHNGIYEAPRRIIAAIPGLEFIEMDRNKQFSRCCGVGGGLKMANHDLQEAASSKRIKDAEEKGVEFLTTPCPTCYSGLSGAILNSKSEIKILHLAELVSQSMGIPSSLYSLL